MKIGIVTSGLDMLPLFKFLNKYDCEYHIYWDWNNGSYGDKDFEYSLWNVEKWIDYLSKKWVDFIILPPIFELKLLWKYKQILPLFKNYLNNCLSKSLIWKLWFIWDSADISNIDSLFNEISLSYCLTENQKSISKFHFPFCIWKKQLSIWKVFLLNYGFRSWMVNRAIRDDLRYFKDAWVDTLIPLNYWYFAFERTIKQKLNLNKIRFAWVEQLEKWFVLSEKTGTYWVSIYNNWTTDFLLNNKKFLLLLTRWNKISINFCWL